MDARLIFIRWALDNWHEAFAKRMEARCVIGGKDRRGQQSTQVRCWTIRLTLLVLFLARFEIRYGFSGNPILGFRIRGKIAYVFGKAAIASRMDIPAATILVLARGQLRR